MERLATDLEARCISTAPVGDELVVTASAGSPEASSSATLVGQRLRDVEVALALTRYGFPKPTGSGGIDAHIERILEAGSHATELLGGRVPAIA